MKISKLIIYFVCACSILNVQAQTKSPAGLELELLPYFKKIFEWRSSRKENYYDSVAYANEVFTKKFRAVIAGNPNTLHHPFKKLSQEGLDIASSPDGSLRIYSWDTQTGGTMRNFDNLFQYRSNGRVLTYYDQTIDEGGISSWYDSIFQLKDGNRTIYLATSYYIGSTIALGGSIQLFVIEKDRLVPAKIIKTGSGMQSRISIGYDATKVLEGDQQYPHFSYDSRSKIISIPLIDSNDAPTGKFIKYQFDGKQFTRIK